MEIIKCEIKVEDQSVNPMLNIWVDLEFKQSTEIPISLSGKLCHQSGKILSVFTEYELNADKKYGIALRTKEQEYKSRYNVQLSAALSPLAIEFIENQREKHPNKSVEFYMEFVSKTLTAPTDLNNLSENDLLFINIKKDTSRKTIEQSDWVVNYSPKLGIGNFLLLELNILKPNIPVFGKDIVEPLLDSILEMEKNIRLGDWKRTIENSRPFFELLNKQPNNKFKEELKKVLILEQHNEEGINNLLTGIKSFFDFTSKYIHIIDRSNNLKSYPNAKKEDAYFVYTLSIGLLNMITNKILQNEK